MLRNGKYSVCFKTPSSVGTGFVTLSDGHVTGEDSVITYVGAYQEQGDQFTATVSTHRHSEGHPSIFGIDKIDLDLSGTSKGGIVASGVGTVRQVPGIPLEATLIKVAD